MNILFLGAPSSGKSTQGQILAETRKMRWISSGELFRQSERPEIKEILKKAQLVSDEITNEMMIAEIERSGKDGIIFDGYPRNRFQAETLSKSGVKIAMIVEVAVPIEEIIKRAKERGREQDTEDIVRERVEIYKRYRDEIVDFYRQEGSEIIEIDGMGSIEEISKKVEEATR